MYQHVPKSCQIQQHVQVNLHTISARQRAGAGPISIALTTRQLHAKQLALNPISTSQSKRQHRQSTVMNSFPNNPYETTEKVCVSCMPSIPIVQSSKRNKAVKTSIRLVSVYFLAASSAAFASARLILAPRFRFSARVSRRVTNALNSFSSEVMARGASAVYPDGRAGRDRVMWAVRSSPWISVLVPD